MKTGIQALRDNDRNAAEEILNTLRINNIPYSNPELHAKLLGYPYNKGGFEADTTNGIRRIMVELKVLSIWGKHNCPDILLSTQKNQHNV